MLFLRFTFVALRGWNFTCQQCLSKQMSFHELKIKRNNNATFDCQTDVWILQMLEPSFASAALKTKSPLKTNPKVSTAIDVLWCFLEYVLYCWSVWGHQPCLLAPSPEHEIHWIPIVFSIDSALFKHWKQVWNESRRLQVRKGKRISWLSWLVTPQGCAAQS